MKDWKIKSLVFISQGMLAIEALIFSNVIETLLNFSVPVLPLIIWLILMIVQHCLSLVVSHHQQIKLQQARLDLLHDVLFYDQDDVKSAHAVKVCQEDVEKVMSYQLAIFPESVLSLVMLIFYLGYMFYMNHIFCVIIVVIGLLRSFVPLYMNRFFSYQYERTMELEEDMNDFYYVVIKHFQKAWFFENRYFYNRLKEKHEPYYKVGKNSEKVAQLENALQNFFDVLSQFGLCFIGIILMSQHQLSYATMLSMIVLSQMFFSLITSLCQGVREYRLFQVSLKRIDLLKGKEDQRLRLNDFRMIDINIKPSFLPYRFVCRLPHQGIVVVKGKNGSGKSTFLKMLLNIEKDYEGRIMIDDHHVQDIQMSSLCAYAKQNTMVMDLSLMELCQDCLKEELAYYQHVFSFNDHLLNENIGNLSSGEQKKAQLISLFLSHKRILVLDEPETSLDDVSRQQLVLCMKNYDGLVIVATNTILYDKESIMEVNVYEE